MFDDFRPFELLKLIRDSGLTEEEFRHLSMTHYWGPADQFLLPLIKLGFLRHEAGAFKANHELFENLQAIQVSLSELADYGRRSLVVTPFFGKPVHSNNAAEIFVVMPFKEELREVYDSHIRAVASRIDRTVSRADDFFTATTVLSDVWSAIWNAQLIIADCTGRNANVFYEVGIAHTVGKPVILLAQREEDIPFDVKHLRCILYEQTAEGLNALERALESAIVGTEPKQTLADELAELRQSK